MDFDVKTFVTHTSEGHWVATSNIATTHPEVVVYAYCTLPMLARAQIASLPATQHPTIKIKFMDVQMQSGMYV